MSNTPKRLQPFRLKMRKAAKEHDATQRYNYCWNYRTLHWGGKVWVVFDYDGQDVWMRPRPDKAIDVKDGRPSPPRRVTSLKAYFRERAEINEAEGR